MKIYKVSFHAALHISTIIVCALLTCAIPAAADPSNAGRSFWLTFPANLAPSVPNLSLRITALADAEINIAVPGPLGLPILEFETTRTLAAGESTTVFLPPLSAEPETPDLTGYRSVRVQSTGDVNVMGMNNALLSADGFLALPTNRLGTNHLVMSYPNDGLIAGSQFSVVAVEDHTWVSVTPTATTGIRVAGHTYQIFLHEGEVHQLRNEALGPPHQDLTETRIVSDKPVAVFGGHRAGHVPTHESHADHMVEQLPPVEHWGSEFFTTPLANRDGGDTFRILAGADATSITIDGALVATLDRGETHETILTNASRIFTDGPALVAQFAHGGHFDGRDGDPFMMLVPARGQHLLSYAFSLPTVGFANHYLNIVAPEPATAGIHHNGAALSATLFEEIAGTRFFSAQVSIAPGPQTLTSSLPIGVTAYGFDPVEGYGQPAGLGLTAIGAIDLLTASPASATNQAGSAHFFQASVVDGAGAPMPGIRVDFEVAGLNDEMGFAHTGQDGVARLHYQDQTASAGLDVITVIAGAHRTTLENHWTTAAGLTLVGAASITTEATSPAGAIVVQEASVTDSSGSATTVTWRVDGEAVQVNVLPDGALTTLQMTNLYTLGAHDLEIHAVNAEGIGAGAHSTVQVVDSTPPDLTILGDNPMELIVGSQFDDPGAVATDLYEGDLTSSIQDSGAVDEDTVGVYTINYTVRDAQGNQATAQRLVEVTEKIIHTGDGLEFWLTFPGNSPSGLGTNSILIAAVADANVEIAIPGVAGLSQPAFETNVLVNAGASVSVDLPVGLAETELIDGTGFFGVRILADRDVSVFGVNQNDGSSDGFSSLPVDSLGTEHIVLGYPNDELPGGSQFTIVGVEDGTTVTVTPSVTTGTRPAGVPFNVELDAGEVYQLRNVLAELAPFDLSGTEILANKPVVVLGGHRRANVPIGVETSGHLVEQLPPVHAWGRIVHFSPLATRTGGDTVRVIASENATTVAIDGVSVAILDRGEVHDAILSQSAVITADKPILTAQYSHGGEFDNAAGGPFMIVLPPAEQYLTDYLIATPTEGFTVRYLNIVAPDAAVGAVTMNGVAIAASEFAPLGASGHSAAQVAIPAGPLALSSPWPFGATVYGFGSTQGFGYPGGQNTASVALLDDIQILAGASTNAIGGTLTSVALATDTAGVPLPGALVNFAVAGANPALGFGFTDLNGMVSFAYSGSNPNGGHDEIAASIGFAEDTEIVEWRGTGLPEIHDLNDLVFDATGPGNVPYIVQPTIDDPEADQLVVTIKLNGVQMTQLTLPPGMAGSPVPVSLAGALPLGVHNVEYIAYDWQLSPVSATATLTAVNVPPTITLLGESLIVLNVGDPFIDPGATASDLGDGDLTSQIILTGYIDTSTPGLYARGYRVYDSAGNMFALMRWVRVIDTAPPALTLGGENPMYVVQGDRFEDPGATALDNANGDITSSIVANGVVDTLTVGSYLLDYQVADASGNVANAQRTVHVVDKGTPDCAGTEFWLALPTAPNASVFKPQTLELTIGGAHAATVEITIPGLNYSATLQTSAGGVVTHTLPSNAAVATSDMVDPRGIRIRATREVCVSAFIGTMPTSASDYTTSDAFLALPSDVLGTRYLVMSYRGLGSRFALAATEDNTIVTITPTATIGPDSWNAASRTAGTPYQIQLNQGDVYQLVNMTDSGLDLTSSTIESDRPVAVFGGGYCSYVPYAVPYCDTIVAQLRPEDRHGRDFVTAPFSARDGGDTFRILTATDGTDLLIDGQIVATNLNRGQIYETILTAASLIQATKAVSVAQFAHGTTYDNRNGDPAMMILEPVSHFAKKHTLVIPTGEFDDNFINIVVPDSVLGSVLLNDIPIANEAYASIGNSGFSWTSFSIASGLQRVSSPAKVWVSAYGFEPGASYAFATAATLLETSETPVMTLSLPDGHSAAAGQSSSVNASLVDAAGAPLAGYRVELTVTGANLDREHAYTDASGVAVIFYTGWNLGQDTITATAGTTQKSVNLTWTTE